ncbi:hypothetical protein HYDPIDRAFT_107541 [Hydnomerulius pinastri MD-312]|nr:hypothetical protein HYDPIDRAFT_107541 [Hydnomerulius pinastri MD-312]
MSAPTTQAVPRGWTDKIVLLATVKTMLAESTGLKVDKVELAEIRGCRYIFSTGRDHYMWNTASEDGAYVKAPTGRAALFAQLEADPSKLELEPLPEAAPAA